MIHPRQAIRTALVAQLVNANTDAEERVFPTREVPWKRVELPGIAVFALDEQVRQEIPDERARTVKVVVLGVVTLDEKVDDALDALALQVEQAVRSDRTVGGTAFRAFLSDTQIGVDEKQARPTGGVALTYEIAYEFPAGA